MHTSTVIFAVRSCSEAQLRDIAAATGIPVPTLAKIRYGVTTDPRASTVDVLRDYFAAHGAPSLPDEAARAGAQQHERAA
jgi:hypothetical protein